VKFIVVLLIAATAFACGCATSGVRTQALGVDGTAAVGAATADSAATVARVEKALSVAAITLPEVATFLSAYNLDVVNRAAWLRPHWRAATPPWTYNVFRPYIATADTTVEFMVRGHISGTWPADVQAVWIRPDGTVVKGQVSPLGWNDNGTGAGALPGLGR
jgi:hypothetical protein